MRTHERAGLPSTEEIVRWGRIAHDYLRGCGVRGALVGGLYDRDDLVQEILVRLMRIYPRKLREGRPVSTTYVRLASRSVHLDVLRRLGKRPPHADAGQPSLGPVAPPGTPGPLRAAPARELRKYLAGKQLKAYRAYLDTGSYREAAGFLRAEYPGDGWTEKNVRSYCSHAHTTLRRKAEAGEL